MKRNFLKCVSYVLVLSFLFTVIPVTNSAPTLTFAKDSVELWNENGVQIIFTEDSVWETGFEARITIVNNSASPLENWKIKVKFQHEIVNLWDGRIESKNNGEYTIQYPTWNSKIPAGGKAVIGLTGACNGKVTPPAGASLLNKVPDVTDNKQFQITYRTTSDWKDAFNGEITIKNLGEKPIENWNLEFDFDKTIKQYWNAKLVSIEGEHYILKHDDWNSVIKPGASVSFGFEGNPGNVTNEPKNFKLSSSKVDSNDGSNNDSKDDFVVEGDADLDGLLDPYEKSFTLTDPNKWDTDGDGLSDGYEYLITETDPLKKDTDGNGINDGDEDFDKDGLINKKEQDLPVSDAPFNPDIDQDGLLDGDEVLKYNTDPRNPDTDGDGLLDGDEVAIGLNPNKKETNKGIPDADYKSWQQPKGERWESLFTRSPYDFSMKVLATGNAEQIALQTNYEPILWNNPAVVGRVIDVNYEYKIEKGEIYFKLKSSFLKEQTPIYPEQKLGIRRYAIFQMDEKNGILHPVPTLYKEKENLIYTTYAGKGTFCLIDLESLVYDLGIVERDLPVGYNENKVISDTESITKKDLYCGRCQRQYYPGKWSCCDHSQGQ